MLRIGIRTKIVLLSFVLTCMSVFVGGVILVQRVSTALEDEMGQRAISIARTVAQLGEIKQNVGLLDGAKQIEPIAERIRLTTDVQYIVILDMHKIRYSSPLETRIGTVFEGGDEAAAFTEQEYLSHAQGVLGPSVRAFVPIMNESGHQQIGVVVVGILTPTIEGVLHNIRSDLYSDLLIGVLIGLLGSWILAANIKKQMFYLEPTEIAKLLEERMALIESIHEGIIAVDRDQKITLINEYAMKLLGVDQDCVGTPVAEVMPGSRLDQVIDSKEAILYQPLAIRSTYLLMSRIPIRVKNRIVGAVAIFQDRTEVHRLAEELTGVKEFVEALRVQNHEHMNKLHTIAGLTQLKQYDKVLDFIFSVTEEQGELTKFLTKHFYDYSFAGLLMGKFGRAKELNIELMIDRNSRLTSPPKGIDTHSLVIIVGNLLDNAMDALQQKEGDRSIYCLILSKKDGIHIIVEDNGSGMQPEDQEHIFDHGFTTKEPPNQGIGLFLVRQQVDFAGGTIQVSSHSAMGTTFTVYLPQ